MSRHRVRLAIGVLAAAMTLWPVASTAQPRRELGRAAPSALVDVPFVAQSEELCGGAALAMVRRYWGDQSVVAEDFAALVDADQGGISISRLTDAARSGPWTTVSFAATLDAGGVVREQLRLGRPVIALIEDRPGALHYVVVVGRTDAEVVFHDPARAPFRRLPAEQFDHQWMASNQWMMAVLPSAGQREERSGLEAHAAEAVTEPGGPCQQLVADAITAAAEGALHNAGDMLEAAVRSCRSASAWRELSGVRFLQKRWTEAEDAAAQSVALDDGDRETWRLLGAARFMRDDLDGALDAWNHLGGPSVSQIAIGGTVATPHPVLIEATGLRPRRALTARSFGRAARRLADLPSVQRSALALEPGPNQAVTVRAAVVERSMGASGWLGWSIMGARSVATQTLRVEVASLFGSAELWTGQWRWAERRPSVAFSLDAPVPGARGGVARVEAQWERQTYAAGSGVLAAHERRRSGLHIGDWASPNLRWEAGMAVDRFDDDGFAAVSGKVDRRGLDDRVSVRTEVEGWLSPSRRHEDFARGLIGVAVRNVARDVPRWSARGTIVAVSAGAPLAIWPRAGINHDSEATARAHSSRIDDVVPRPSIGRVLLAVSVEHARPVATLFSHDVHWATFIDAVAIAGRSQPGTRHHLDVGGGLRVALPGVRGILHLDAAYGLGDRAVRLSAVVRHEWPGR